ncbi:hypothetical protein PF007_g12703 [Phytophthora fragariae]|uniref:Uncharacterized protein n=2 Tax=Phytophthora fragariae TaxID=53985 RepID=A0A6A3SL97_9STRA|nr:hypothetical protein PF007_g12703 [Phytophthora fragariae]KAE9118428.1 hypothetical protein PF006_g18596 [Phytophthora fragariae]
MWAKLIRKTVDGSLSGAKDATHGCKLQCDRAQTAKGDNGPLHAEQRMAISEGGCMARRSSSSDAVDATGADRLGQLVACSICAHGHTFDGQPLVLGAIRQQGSEDGRHGPPRNRDDVKARELRSLSAKLCCFKPSELPTEAQAAM